MIKLSFKTAFRYLWKHKLFTALNIAGLAIGICTCWVILSIVRYEFSFESGIPEQGNTYRLVTGKMFDNKETIYGGVSAPFYQGVRENVTGVKAVVPVYGQWFSSVKVDNGKELIEVEEPEDIIATDSSYFEMVPYKWLAGSAHTAFLQPESVVLTRSRANSYFPGFTPGQLIGKTITYDETTVKTISGIVEDLHFPSEFTAQEILYLKPAAYPLVEWTNTNSSDKLYIIAENDKDPATILKQIQQVSDQKWQEFKQERNPGYEFVRWFSMIPLSEMHFATHVNEWQVKKTSKNVLFGLIGTAIFILFLACINYINLSTAQIPQRGKEIGIRKTLGSNNKSLLMQIFAETIIVVLAGTLLSLILVHFSFLLLSDMIPQDAVNFQFHTNTLLILVAILAATILSSGIYPAIQMMRVNPIQSIKNGLSQKSGKSRFNVRKGLFIFQYTIAQCFIIGAIIIGQQLKYTLKKDLGFNKEAVVLVDHPFNMTSKAGFVNKEKVLTEELQKLPGVTNLTFSESPLRMGYSSSPYVYAPADGTEPVSRQLQIKMVDHNYLDFYQIPLVAGKGFIAGDSSKKVILNETAVKAYGIPSPEEAIGKTIKRSDQFYSIAGVVKDFHQENFYKPIEPIVLMQGEQPRQIFNIKLGSNSEQWPQTIAAIKATWSKFYADKYFEYHFYDETIEALYKEDQRLSTLINIATFISVFIGCLGLFGLATLTAFQKTKEIGIRKVLGASVSSIVSLLSKDFVKLVLIAIVIASPIAWWAMNKWLEDFIYKVPITIWTFLTAGVLAIIIAFVTVSVQAVKAAVVNPVNSLRDE